MPWKTAKHHFSKKSNSQPGKNKAWYVFKQLQDKFDSNRKEYKNKVLTHWLKRENKLYSEQNKIIEKALSYYNEGETGAAKDYLTEYCGKTAKNTINDTKELTKSL